MGARTVRVAAVQVESKNGAIDENLANAEPWVARAAARGAELVLLPELLATGYLLGPAMWDAAEPRRGPTVRWLSEQSARHRVYAGASFLEAEGEDFFNTFVLTAPGGEEAGRVRKQTPAGLEAFFMRGDGGPHAFDTALGRIGVGICYENQLADTARLMHAQSVDLMLMPHSAPSPRRGRPVPSSLVDAYEALLRALPEHYARLLGVPVVMVNKCGPWESPVPGLPFLRQRSRFAGESAIADSDGALAGRLAGEEDLLIADVTLDPARKTAIAPSCRGHWALDVPRAASEAFRAIESIGASWYGLSRGRAARARAIAARG